MNLCVNFLKSIKKQVFLSEPVVSILLKSEWKGNVRELKNAMEHAVALAQHEKILPQDLPTGMLHSRGGAYNSFHPILELPFHNAKQEFERHYFMGLLKNIMGKCKLFRKKRILPVKNFI